MSYGDVRKRHTRECLWCSQMHLLKVVGGGVVPTFPVSEVQSATKSGLWPLGIAVNPNQNKIWEAFSCAVVASFLINYRTGTVFGNPPEGSRVACVHETWELGSNDSHSCSPPLHCESSCLPFIPRRTLGPSVLPRQSLALTKHSSNLSPVPHCLCLLPLSPLLPPALNHGVWPDKDICPLCPALDQIPSVSGNCMHCWLLSPLVL